MSLSVPSRCRLGIGAVVVGGLAILVMELALAIADWGLGDKTFKFSTWKASQLGLHAYPDRPAEYIKIAVFGESAAAGCNAERGFVDVLRHELPKSL